MSSLEEKIKLLERELALKQAYLSVAFSFPKSSKLPKDVQEQVMGELKKACTQLAENKEETAPNLELGSKFSADELNILQELVQSVKVRKAQPLPPSAGNIGVPRKEPKVTLPKGPKEEPRKARILTLENTEASVKAKVSSMSVVSAVNKPGGKAFCVSETSGSSFYIPQDDLEYLE